MIGRIVALSLLGLPLATASPAFAQEAADACQLGDYQLGQDTPWVPTPDSLVEAMLDLVKITPRDYAIDLGSGDGRMVIAAARRGTPGHGVEYNPDMLACANQRAKEAGVTDKVKFVQGDMFKADLSQATVLPLFLLTQNLDRLMPTFLKLAPGTRIAVNTFRFTGWQEDETVTVTENCTQWCTANLWIVPAQAGGTWTLGGLGELVLQQEFQMISGTLSSNGVTRQVTGRLRDTRIVFNAGDVEYSGTVQGDTMSVRTASGSWSGTRKGP